MRRASTPFLATVLVLSFLVMGRGIASVDTPSISLAPGVGPPTTAVSVTGSGFGPTEQVLVRFDTIRLVRGSTDGTGTFVLLATIPSSALPGAHMINAVGKSSQAKAQAIFTVRTDWGQRQFSADHLGVNPYENVISTANVGALQEKWTASLPGYGIAQPIVVGGVVYVGGTIPATPDAWVEAVDASTGELRWFHRIRQGGDALTPVAWGDLVIYSIDLADSIRAYDEATGTPAWTFHADAGVSDPVISDDTVYVATAAGTLYALDPATGEELWSAFVAPLGIYSPPAVTDGKVFVGAYGMAAALDAQTGAPLWSATLLGQLGSPTVGGGVMYAGSLGAGIYALSEVDGSILWNLKDPSYVGGSLALSEGRLYFGSADNSVYAVDADTGALVWKVQTGDDVGSAAVIANGVLFIGSTDSREYAYDAATGEELWTFRMSEGGIGSGAGVSDGVVYIPSYDQHLYAFGLS